MKKILLTYAILISCIITVSAQNFRVVEGSCGIDTHWKFDGQTLTITNVSKKLLPVEIEDYEIDSKKRPWKNFNVKKVVIGSNIKRIGSCAFARMSSLQDVEFLGTDLNEIGWAAFLDCKQLRTMSLPVNLSSIETIAFANCNSLTSVIIPNHCKVEDQAFLSCKGLTNIEISPTAQLGHYVFAHEININGMVRHALCKAEIKRLPNNITPSNCHQYGLDASVVDKFYSGSNSNVLVDYDYPTSELDTIIPKTYYSRNDVYVLVIGNQNYRFVPNVPYAIHDARVFSQYCKLALGIPTNNIHIAEDATKAMIVEEEYEWLSSITNKEDKKLIVYYAGHGVPDIKDKNKAYLLPTDVRGTKPNHGIALDNLYARIGDLGFKQTAVFLDACFSGVTRNSEAVNEDTRGVEIVAESGDLSNGCVVVFSAAQGNETAQGYPEEGHGLFTYYLLKKMNESPANLYFGDLSNYLEQKVKEKAPELRLRKSQTPTTSWTKEIENKWRYLEF